MKPKTLYSLGLVAVVLAGAAAWVATRQPPGVQAAPAEAGKPVLDALQGHVNDVAEVRITTASESFTLKRTDTGWGLADKGGYPIDVGKVKALVMGLAGLKLIEEKTANPALFDKLDVQDPTSSPDAPSKEVRLADASGKVLADVVIGRSQYGGGPSSSSVYVRKADGGPALEALGKVQVSEHSSDWLDRQIVKLERKRVHDVTITQPDGETLELSKASPELTDFTVQDLPEGAELSWAGVAGGIAGALEYMTLQDVIPASDAEFDDSKAVVARFTTFDGLVVTARTVERDSDVLLKIDAKYDESARVPEAEGPPTPPAGEDADKTGDEASKTQTPADQAPVGKSPEEVQKEAQDIDQRVGSWVYVLPGYSGANLRKRLDDLLKKPEESQPALFDGTGGNQGGAPAPGGEPETTAPAEEGGETPAAQPTGQESAPAGGGEPTPPAPDAKEPAPEAGGQGAGGGEPAAGPGGGG